jgi:hypothetical protein
VSLTDSLVATAVKSQESKMIIRMENYIIEGHNKILTLDEATLIASEMSQKSVKSILSESYSIPYIELMDAGDYSDYEETFHYKYPRIKKNLSIADLKLCIEILQKNYSEKIKNLELIIDNQPIMSLLYTVIGTDLIFDTESKAQKFAKELLLKKSNYFNIDLHLCKTSYRVNKTSSSRNNFKDTFILDHINDTISIEQLQKAVALLEEKSRLDIDAQKMVQTVELL